MSLEIASINSGSNGNCYYVGNQQEAILVDAGISCRETERRMKKIGLAMEKIKAIFISHEHGDHIAGLPALIKKYRIPVYITPNTLAESRLPLEKEFVRSFKPHESVTIGSLTITNFPKYHDAADPYSFVIASETVKVGVFTDIGKVCKEVKRYFKECHACFLEANYDEDMLEKGHYPTHLKNRIRGGEGHLSNSEALQLFLEHRASQLTHLILSHLSKNNNDPKLVQSLFEKHANGTNIITASRYQESDVYLITEKFAGIVTNSNSKKKRPSSQLRLFGE
jgi:phosphoribosyl 1,2-cyclic phosphodiesterase